MRIARITTEQVYLSLDRPIRTAIHDIQGVGCVLVRAYAKNDQQGQGFCFSLNAERLSAFETIIHSFFPIYTKARCDEAPKLWQQTCKVIAPMGEQGIAIGALSALDTAVWDLYAKLLDKPLHRLFGHVHDSLPTYASSGLWLSDSIDSLQQQASAFLAQGFRALKIRIGEERWQQDIARVAAVREVVGDYTTLLVDANQAFTSKDAISLAKKLADYQVQWLEEPVVARDYQASSEVRQAIPMLLASGESEYTRYAMRKMITSRACDVLMPDLQRIGGISEMQKVLGLAAAFDMPISTHFFTEYSLCIAASSQNTHSVEHINWFAPLFDTQPALVDGCIVVPENPGTGFCFDENAIQEFSLSG